MIHIAIRVRELVSSNVDTLVNKAGEQHKMLRLLQTEIEEALIGLHGDVAKSRREHDRQSHAEQQLAVVAEEWTAKAKIAVDHGREDLARAALLARESERKKVSLMQGQIGELADQIAEMEAAIAELEEKRTHVGARIADLPKPEAKSGKSGDNRTARKMDRIDALDRRAGFTGTDTEDLAPESIEAEIAALQQGSAIDAELEAMKAPAPAPAKRTRKKAK